MALRAGSVGLGREAGLGARRGWTRRRRHPHARGTPGRARPRGPPPPHPARLPPPAPLRRSPPAPASHLRGGRVGGRRDGCRGEGRERPGPRWRGGSPAGSRGPTGARAPGGPAAAATLDASRALPVDRPSCGGRRGRPRGARRAPARPRPRARARVCAGGVRCVRVAPRHHPASSRRRAARVRVGSRRAGPPAGCAPGAAVPRGASPRPAPSSRLRTGADQGIRLFN